MRICPRPGWALVALALVPPLAGLWRIVQLRAERAIPRVEVGGIVVSLDRAAWVRHEMLDAEASRGMPASMVPDLPPPGRHRLSVELTATNARDIDVALEGLRLVGVDESGRTIEPVSPLPEALALRPGHRVVFDTRFDVPQSVGTFSLELRQRALRAPLFALPVPAPAPVGDRRPAGSRWPDSVAALPEGDPEVGRELYDRRFGCAACHGRADEADSNGSGPHLSALAVAGGSRVPGQSAAQYVYDSIRDPGAFIAPRCARDLPCDVPSTMPPYGALLSIEEMAHLVAFVNGRFPPLTAR